MEEKNEQRADMKMVVCPHCKVTLEEGQKFCHNCGSPAPKPLLGNDDISLDNVILPPKKEKKKYLGVQLVQKILLLLLSILIFIAPFLPIIKYHDDSQNVDISFNLVDEIIMFANSFGRLDDEDTAEMIRDAYNDVKGYQEEWEKNKELDKYVDYVKDVLRIELRSAEYEVSFVAILCAILAILQLILSIGLVIFAFFSLISEISSNIKDFSRLTLHILGINTIVMLGNTFLFRYSFGLHALKIKMAVPQVLICILFLLVVTALIVCRVIVRKEKISIGTGINHAVSLILSVLLLISIFAPLVRTEIKTSFDNKMDMLGRIEKSEPKKAYTDLDYSLFFSLNLSEREKEAYFETEDAKKTEEIKRYFEGFGFYTKLQFRNGEAMNLNQRIYSRMLFAYGAYEFSGFFSFGVVASWLLAVFSLVFIWINLYEMITGKRTILVVPVLTKIFAILMAIILILILVIMSFIVNYNAEGIGLIYESKIAYGSIMSLVCTILLASVPPAIPKDKEEENLQ